MMLSRIGIACSLTLWVAFMSWCQRPGHGPIVHHIRILRLEGSVPSGLRLLDDGKQVQLEYKGCKVSLLPFIVNRARIYFLVDSAVRDSAGCRFPIQSLRVGIEGSKTRSAVWLEPYDIEEPVATAWDGSEGWLPIQPGDRLMVGIFHLPDDIELLWFPPSTEFQFYFRWGEGIDTREVALEGVLTKEEVKRFLPPYLRR